MCLAVLKVPYLYGTEQDVTLSAQSWIDLGCATGISQNNSESRLVFCKSSWYVCLGGAHHVMWQFSAPFGFLKKVSCSELRLKWFNKINTFLFNKSNQGKMLYNLWVQPFEWTQSVKENKMKIHILTGTMFSKQIVIISNFSFYCLIFSFILQHITRPETTQLAAIAFQQLAGMAGAHTPGQGISQHLWTFHIPPACQNAIAIYF